MLSMTRVESIPLAAMKVGLPWTWESFPEMLAAIAARPKAVNFGALLPLCPLLTYVLGSERAKAGVLPYYCEHAELRRWPREAMQAGALGGLRSAWRRDPARISRRTSTVRPW